MIIMMMTGSQMTKPDTKLAKKKIHDAIKMANKKMMMLLRKT